jgi:AraC-like DNA-binding protein/mannose-6-phosphate isomerase-like protein (cupin superfamily)
MTAPPAQSTVPRSRSRDAADYQFVPRTVTAMGKEKEHASSIEAHSHPRGQLLYAIEGVMRVTCGDGVWLIPPQRALWIPAGVMHELTMLGDVHMRTLYIEAEAGRAFGDVCRLLEVTRLLRELILALVALPIEYPVPGRGEHLAALILTEIAVAPTVPIEIPWPRDRRLVAVCGAILAEPDKHCTIEQWADFSGASSRTLMRLFSKETGLQYRQWLRQVHVAETLLRLTRGDSVGSIARALGYGSPSAFTAMFRRQMGQAPNQYMKARAS